MATTDGIWHPGIGDPTWGGWLTVVAYVGATALCWRAARAQPASTRGFWQCMTVLLVLLGINKQLDLQTGFTALGSWMAHSQGWYERRRVVQVAFISLMALAGGVMLWLLLRRAGSYNAAQRLGLTGLVVLGVFVLMRAASFHHMDEFLGETVLGLRWNWLLENSGILLIGLAAHRATPPTRAAASQ